MTFSRKLFSYQTLAASVNSKVLTLSLCESFVNKCAVKIVISKILN